MIVVRGMNGNEFLQISHLSKVQYYTFPSSKWQVGILAPVVQPAADFLSVNIADDFHRGTV